MSDTEKCQVKSGSFSPKLLCGGMAVGLVALRLGADECVRPYIT